MNVTRVVADFIDTNVWVYAHTAGVDDSKSEAAQALLQRISSPVISTQVLGEYCAVMIRNRLPDQPVGENLDAMISMCMTLPVSAAALEAGCESLYTEDLQHEQIIEDRLQIVNPFIWPPSHSRTRP